MFVSATSFSLLAKDAVTFEVGSAKLRVPTPSSAGSAATSAAATRQ